jgi:hypothetical protein
MQDDSVPKRLGYYPNTFFAHAPCANSVFRWNGLTAEVEKRKGVHTRNLLQVTPFPTHSSVASRGAWRTSFSFQQAGEQ